MKHKQSPSGSRLLKRIVTAVGLFFPVLYLTLFTIDIFTVPTTAPNDQEKAAAYLTTHDLPQPSQPFKTDGCTAWPDRILTYDFQTACLDHDIAYWAGGSTTLKIKADKKLRENVAAAGPLAEKLYAPLIYNAVKYGGNNLISQRIGSQWGFGQNQPAIKPLYIGDDFTF